MGAARFQVPVSKGPGPTSADRFDPSKTIHVQQVSEHLRSGLLPPDPLMYQFKYRSIDPERSAVISLESGFCGVELIMRRSSWTPSIVPESGDQNIYLVMDDLGRLGRIWTEADAETTDLEP